MKGIFLLLIVGGLLYGGWVFYGQTQSRTSGGPTSRIDTKTPTLSLQNPEQSISNLESVLGASISNGVDTITSALNNVTNGASEPIINKAISNFQQELSKLPEDQMKKFQYNYCKTIVEEYEKSNIN